MQSRRISEKSGDETCGDGTRAEFGRGEEEMGGKRSTERGFGYGELGQADQDDKVGGGKGLGRVNGGMLSLLIEEGAGELLWAGIPSAPDAQDCVQPGGHLRHYFLRQF